MSNQSLKDNILNTLKSFKSNQCDIDSLISSIELNGEALDNIPYNMVQEIRDIEYLLTVSQFGVEYGETPIEEVIIIIESWLNKIPV